MESNCDLHTVQCASSQECFDMAAFQTVEVKDSTSEEALIPPAALLASLSLDELKAIAQAVSSAAKCSERQTVTMEDLLPEVPILPSHLVKAPAHSGATKAPTATVAQEEQKMLESIATKLAEDVRRESFCPPPVCSKELTLEDALSVDRFGKGASEDLKESCRDALAAILTKYSGSPQK